MSLVVLDFIFCVAKITPAEVALIPSPALLPQLLFPVFPWIISSPRPFILFTFPGSSCLPHPPIVHIVDASLRVEYLAIASVCLAAMLQGTYHIIRLHPLQGCHRVLVSVSSHTQGNELTTFLIVLQLVPALQQGLTYRS